MYVRDMFVPPKARNIEEAIQLIEKAVDKLK
jgi:hypothetical protein